MGRNRWDMGKQPSAHHGRDRRVTAPAADRPHRPLHPTALGSDRACPGSTRHSGALDDLVAAGKVRYIGCSNFHSIPPGALGRSGVHDWARFVSVQLLTSTSLLFREFERELFPLCLEEGIGVIPYNPIAGGMLSGKHDRTKAPDRGTRFALGLSAAKTNPRIATGTTTCSTPSTSS